MQVLDAAAVAAWAASCVRGLEALRADIDSINVYPVPDSDTGSNLLYTVSGAYAALEEGTADGAGDALELLARGAVTSARGNSGVILSQLLRGLAESTAGAEAVDAIGLAAALATAERMATRAVARPVDGTMLTVLHAAAEAAGHAAGGALADVARAASSEAAAALARTPSQLPVLADAGVVDAGGRGVLAVVDELHATITGEPAAERVEFIPREAAVVAAPSTSSQPWEVMYLLDAVSEADLTALREKLSELGDCVTIAGDGAGSHAVHVHCADIGAALEAGLRAGKPRQVRVESLDVAAQPTGRAVLAVVSGESLAELFRQEGLAVLAGAGGRDPDEEEIQRAITGLAAAHVTVLAGTAELTAVAEDAAESAVAAGRDVVVIPCASPVQVLAAVAVHDAQRRAADDDVAMAEAAAATRRGELSVAAEDAITWVGRAHAGDLIGFVDDEVVLIEAPGGRDKLAGVAVDIVERMLTPGGELVTVITGAQAPDGVTDELTSRLADNHPEIDVVTYRGDQSGAVLTFGVE